MLLRRTVRERALGLACYVGYANTSTWVVAGVGIDPRVRCAVVAVDLTVKRTRTRAALASRKPAYVPVAHQQD